MCFRPGSAGRDNTQSNRLPFRRVYLHNASAILGTGEPEELILERIDNAPVDGLAPAIGMDVSELIDRLGNDGIVVDDPGMSIRLLAVRYGAETG